VDQTLQQRRRLPLFLAPLFLTILLSGVLAVRTVRDLTDDEGVLAQAHGVLDQVAMVNSGLSGCEFDVSTYLLTSDATYRSAYAAERTVTAAGIARLQAATANDPAQRGRDARLTPLIAQRLALLQQASDLRAPQRRSAPPTPSLCCARQRQHRPKRRSMRCSRRWMPKRTAELPTGSARRMIVYSRAKAY
jgi:CHASE3 domain sensor protein